VWGGARLIDVFEALDPSAGKANAIKRGLVHVQFVGTDQDEIGTRFEASVPTAIALNEDTNTLLAYEMNGQPLSRDHGYPLRVIVPGVVGTRNVKWVSHVRLADRESDSHWQQHDYKLFSPSSDWKNLDWSTALPIYGSPVQSAIVYPARDAVVKTEEDCIRSVRGYAYSGSGAAVARVDESSDGGKTWHVATLDSLPAGAQARSTFAWRRWHVDLPTSAHANSAEIVCKAVDENYNTQPESLASIWNARGLSNNSWHRVRVTVTHDKD